MDEHLRPIGDEQQQPSRDVSAVTSRRERMDVLLLCCTCRSYRDDKVPRALSSDGPLARFSYRTRWYRLDKLMGFVLLEEHAPRNRVAYDLFDTVTEVVRQVGGLMTHREGDQP